jgi:SOS response regulatory protein OraA/RecX
MYVYALKLLRTRDYTVAGLREKVQARFGSTPQELVQQLLDKNFLNDRRFAENYASRRKEKGRARLQEELIASGVAPALVDDVLSHMDWPSLREAVTARIDDWKVRTPLQSRDAARLFRALLRLGYDEDAIREEIESLREHQ